MSDPSVLTEHSVEDVARAAGLEGRVRFVPVTDSTNADLLAEAERGAEAWTVLVTGHQRTGRGRLGRSWEAPPGSSLLMSVLLRPGLDAEDAPILTLAAGVACVEALGEACGVAAGCTWPNDLTIAGRKVGGILAEGAVAGGKLAHVVIGVGVNVLQRREDLPPGLEDRATSVAIEGGRTDLPGLLAAFLLRLRASTAQADPAGRAPLLARYRSMCDTLGREIRATTSSGRVVQGRAESIGGAGELLIRTPGGTEAVTFGEVQLVR